MSHHINHPSLEVKFSLLSRLFQTLVHGMSHDHVRRHWSLTICIPFSSDLFRWQIFVIAIVLMVIVAIAVFSVRRICSFFWLVVRSCACEISFRSTAILSGRKWLLKMNHAKVACLEKQSKLQKYFCNLNRKTRFSFPRAKPFMMLLLLG